MPPVRATRAEVVAAVAGLAPADGRSVFVGVDGCGASGKTSLAAAIHAAVAGVDVVHVDDFSGPRVPEWDWRRFRAQLAGPLLAGRPARYRVWGFDRDAGGGWVDVAPGGLVVVEGVSATRREAGVPWALRIWVDAPRELRLARAIARDGESMRARWLADWMPSEERYVARQHPDEHADLWLDGTA